jgi:hypothetical protein
MNNQKEKKVEPSAARLIESLRDTGYTVATSVADIVDNSVAAGASKVEIFLDYDFGGNLYLWIADNGSGMSDDELESAMQYGSPKRPDPKSLGKFGMGLKTASTSFCRKLSVITKKNGLTSLKQWDLDVVQKKNDWILLEPSIDEFEEPNEFLNSLSDNKSGTIVIWEKVDRLLRVNKDKASKDELNKLIEQLEQHLSGVFFNFLDGRDGYPKLNLKINNKIIEPWDPFCRWLNSGDEKRVEIHENAPFVISQKENLFSDEEVIGSFELNVYILPNKSELTEEEIQTTRYGLNNQGFHVFREGRMIFSGGWPNRLFVKEPHLNLIRVELNFDHLLDHYFQIDIKKSRIDIPKEIRDEIKKVLAPARNEANRRYRKGSPKKKTQNADVLGAQHSNSSNVISKHHEEVTSNSKLAVQNPETGETQITNKYGITTIRLKFEAQTDTVVKTKETLEDGVLWLPGLVDGNKHAVFLNESHEFYRKFYLAHKHNSALVLAMDTLLWSLAEAELSVISDQVKRNLEDLRINVSRSLRLLADELPELDLFEDEEFENQESIE